MVDGIWEKINYPDYTFIIAEAGVNHNGSLEKALQLVDVAVNSGVDAIKFQTFKADRLVTTDAKKAKYQCHKKDADLQSQLEMLKRLELSHEKHAKIYSYCKKKGIVYMSTPFDDHSANFLNDINVEAFKIASGEINNSPFLTHIAQMGKPMIISTGMANLDEVKDAVYEINKTGNTKLVLLHCVSNYPADPSDANLRVIHTLEKVFGIPIGFSDHTLGTDVTLAAVALGACIIEKHFTLNRNLPGPDHQSSMEPAELSKLVQSIRTVEKALGHGRKEPAISEAEISSVVRKSLIASLDINVGTTLTEDLITAKRPGTGMPPSMICSVLGRTVNRNIAAGTMLTMDLIK